MARILGIGNATVDIVHTLAAYPAENAEVRCDGRVTCRGGNAANTLVVLSQFGHRCSWAGVLTDDTDGRFVREDLAGFAVDSAHCRVVAGGAMPVSTVLLNTSTGSRTIVHHRDLPEFGIADFRAIPLQHYDWLHFEGRNITGLTAMLEWVRARHCSAPVSLEIEKPRDGIETLFTLADVLLFSQDYARHRGYDDPGELLREVSGTRPDADLYCTWGAAGAAAVDRSGTPCRQPALASGPVVDTLGAGDTFNAGVVAGYLDCRAMPEILQQACDLAGRKCRQAGFAGLAEAD